MERAAGCKQGDLRSGSNVAFYMYIDRKGRWRWQLVANHGIVADSSRGYIHKQDCRDAITLVQGSAGAPIYER